MRRKISVILIVIILSNCCNISVGATRIVTVNKFFQKKSATASEAIKTTKVKKIIATKSTSKRKATSATASNVFHIKPDQNRIYNVSFPSTIYAYLDPGNLSGKGQIFSSHYIVENYGNRDIVIKIKNIDIYCDFEEDMYEFSETKIVDEYSQIKKLNVNMIWKNESENIEKVLNIFDGARDEYVLYLKASEYNENGESINFKEGSKGFFYFTGTINSNPDIAWEDVKITINFDYEIIDAEEERENISIFIDHIVDVKKEKQEDNNSILDDAINIKRE